MPYHPIAGEIAMTSQANETKYALLEKAVIAAGVAACIGIGTVSLAACADVGDPAFGAAPPPRVVERVEFGVVERIDLYRAGNSEPTGLGLVLGGLAGGVIGHQVGGGRGNDVATVAGALGGAFVGNNIEKSRDGDRYRITIRTEDGQLLVLDQMGQGELRVGDQVRIVNGRVYRA
jgi:outer membrane lipoprotein SlyB